MHGPTGYGTTSTVGYGVPMASTTTTTYVSYQNINDIQLKQYIDQIFVRYDVNRSGTLNINELHAFLNELFMMTGYGRTITYQ